MKSTVKQLGPVPFPSFTGERVYMHAFTKSQGLPIHLLRWQNTVDAMLDGIDAPGQIFIMIDQAHVLSGRTHRRGGIHVDGYWHPGVSAHGGIPSRGHRGTPSGGHRGTPPGHSTREPAPFSGHSSPPRGHMHGVDVEETLILASDVFGCRAFAGEFDGEIGIGGDCSHIDVSGLDTADFEPGRAYAGHTLHMLHESIPVRRDAFRTVVRLNVQGAAAEIGGAMREVKPE